jgi:20S proteasome subunit alpha 3
LLIDYTREFSQNYYYKYKSHTPVENVVRYVSDVKQLKTQFGSTRPYGVGFLFAGWDRIFGYQLYSTEPSGVFNGWRAHAIGQNYQNAQSSLKQYYDDNISLSEGIKLAVKVLRKTLDKNKISGDNIDMYVVENVNGELNQRFVNASEINEHLKVLEKEEAEEKSKSGNKDII